jgi:hypothetical protein
LRPPYLAASFRFGQGRSVGRIYKEVHGDPRWCWPINTSPYLAAPPHNVTKTLDEAKQNPV